MRRRITTLGIQILLTIGCIFSNSLLFSQNQIKGIIQDAESKAAIPFANILNLQDGSGVNSDKKGEFRISVNELPATFQISYVGYKTDTVVINSSAKQVIFLKEDRQNLPTIEVSANQKLKAVNFSGFLPKTFVVWEGYIFLLSKNGTFGNYQIETFDTQGNFIKKHEIDIGRIHDLEVNCLNQLYITNKDYGVRLDYQNKRLVPIEKTPIDKLETAFENCICSNENTLFYEVNLKNGLLKRYIEASRNSDETSLLREVCDKKHAAAYDAARGIIGEGNVATNITSSGDKVENCRTRKAQAKADFLQNVFYKNYLENYIHTKDNEVVLFNCDEKKIEIFDEKGELINWVEMQFEPVINAGFKAIISDKETGTYYSIFKEGRQFEIGHINLETGTIGLKQSMEVSAIKRAEIVGGKLFVLGIPENSSGIKRNELMVKNLF